MELCSARVTSVCVCVCTSGMRLKDRPICRTNIIHLCNSRLGRKSASDERSQGVFFVVVVAVMSVARLLICTLSSEEKKKKKREGGGEAATKPVEPTTALAYLSKTLFEDTIGISLRGRLNGVPAIQHVHNVILQPFNSRRCHTHPRTPPHLWYSEPVSAAYGT